MNKAWKIAGIATLVVVLGAVAVGAVALAQEATSSTSGWDLRQRMHEAIASILGVSVEKYESAIETAKTQVLDEAVANGWLTQKQADAIKGRLESEGRGLWMGKGFMGPHLGWGRHGDSLVSIAAEALDMTVSELTEQFKDGKSIADVAEEKGVDPQSIADTYLAQYKEKLDQAVADGDLTQKQADQMLAKMTEAVAEQLEGACGGCWVGGFGGRGGRGRGGMGGPPGWGEL